MAPPSPVGQKPGIQGQAFPATMDQVGSSPNPHNPSKVSVIPYLGVKGIIHVYMYVTVIVIFRWCKQD